MKLLSDARSFFAREQLWGLLLAGILGISALAIFLSRPAGKPAFQEWQKLQQVEDQMQAKVRAVGGVEKYLEQRPGLSRVFHIFTLFLLGGTLAGGFIDIRWLVRPAWRGKLQGSGELPNWNLWGLGTVFKVMLLFVYGGFVLSILFSLFHAFFLRSLSGNAFLLLHTALSDLLCVALVIIFVHRSGGRWKDLGIRFSHFWRDCGVGLVGYLGILPVFFLVLLALAGLSHVFGYEPPPHPLVEVFLEEGKRSPQIVAFSIFLACVAGPIFEEIFFRGFFYPALKKRWGARWGIVLSSALFGAIHHNIFAFWPIFILGVVLAYLYEKRGSLIPSMVLHIVYNTIFISYFFLIKQVIEGS